MQLKDLGLYGLPKGILSRLIIQYWEEDNNIPFHWCDRTEEQKKEFDKKRNQLKDGTLDLDILYKHKDTLYDDLRKFRQCGLMSFNVIVKALNKKMGLFEDNKEAEKLNRIQIIIENKKYSDTPKEIISKIMEVLKDE